MVARSSFFTSPRTVMEVSWGRWSASKKTSGVTLPLKTTHWMTPVPSRSWRKWSFPFEARWWSQPWRVTSWPSWEAMSATWTGGNMGAHGSARGGRGKRKDGRVPRHAPLAEGLPRRQGVVGVADDPEIVHRLAAPARPRDDVVELEPVRRAAHAAAVERPGAAAAVALPDRPDDRGGDVLACVGAAVERRREVQGRGLRGVFGVAVAVAAGRDLDRDRGRSRN